MSYLQTDHRVNTVIQTCQSFAEYPAQKILVGGVLATFSFFFGDLVWMSLVGLGVLIIFDLITGLQAARKSDEEFVLSRMISSTGIKAGMYLIFISSGSVVEWAVPQIPDGLQLINEGIIGTFIFAEFASILENGSKMGYNFPKKILDTIKNTK